MKENEEDQEIDQEAEAVQESPAITAKLEEKKPNRGLIIGIAAIVVILLLLIGTAFYLGYIKLPGPTPPVPPINGTNSTNVTPPPPPPPPPPDDMPPKLPDEI